MSQHHFRRVAAGLNVGPLVAALVQRPGMWEIDTWRQDAPGSAHAATRSIILRGPKDITTAGVFHKTDTVDHEFSQNLLPEAEELVAELLPLTGAISIGRVMIVELPAGASIDEHVDEGAYADHFDRFHICLQAGHVAFIAGEEMVEMKAGEAWWFDHKAPHRVDAHSGHAPRIHLIVDLVSPEYRALRSPDGISMQPETMETFWDDGLPLFEKHWREIAHYQDILLEPDADGYRRVEAAGMLRIYTVRKVPSWELIGYELVFVRPNMHYRSSLMASQDVLFLAPEHRKGRLGMKLIDYADSMLRREGVQVVAQHVKAAHNFGPLLERLGYELQDLIYTRRLDRAKE